MTWSFTPSVKSAKSPVNNESDKILVEPNERGGWSLRFAGDPVSERIGNYPTPQDAERVARANCTHVEIVTPEATKVQSETVANRSISRRLSELGFPSTI